MRVVLGLFFWLDFRSLALFRVGIGLSVLLSLFSRWGDARAYFSSAGVLPYDVLSQNLHHTPWLMFPLVVPADSTFWAEAIFAVGAAASVSLLLGIHARFAAFVAWTVLLCLHHRNMWVENAGDTLLRMMCLWSVFLPIQARWCLKKRETTSSGEASAATMGLVVQVCMVYFISAMSKGHAMWRGEASAIEHVLNLESFHTPLTPWLLENGRHLLPHATQMTLWIEELCPFVLVISSLYPRIRTSLVAAMVVFHLLGIGLFLNVGLFPVICAVTWTVFLPGSFWDALLGKTSTHHTPSEQSWHTTTSRKDPPAYKGMKTVSMLLATTLTLYVLSWNLLSLNDPQLHVLPDWLKRSGRLSGINQNWKLFAPRPETRDGWYVSVARLDDESELDIIRGVQPVSWFKPQRLADEYKSHRWHCYMLSMFKKRNATMLESYANFLVREWEASHPGRRIASLEIYFMLKDSLQPEHGVQPIKLYSSGMEHRNDTLELGTIQPD